MQPDETWGAQPLREETPAPLVRAALAGLVAAVVGGVAWGWVVGASDYEIGILAWAIGLLAGFAVLRAAGGVRGTALQLVAVASALLGVLLGKYLAFVSAFQAFLREGFGDDAAATVSVLSADTVRLFRDELSTVFSGYDALWVGLAVVTAWRMLRPAAPDQGPGEAPNTRGSRVNG